MRPRARGPTSTLALDRTGAPISAAAKGPRAAYLLVPQDGVWVEHYVRTTDEGWILHDTLPGGTLSVASCGIELRADEFYLKVFDSA